MPAGTGSKVSSSDDGFWDHWIGGPDVGVRLRASVENYVVEDHWMPLAIELETLNQDPQIRFRVDVGHSGPRLTRFAFESTDPDSHGIRQADFREVQVGALVEDLVAGWTFRIERDNAGQVIDARVSTPGTRAFSDSLRIVGRLRAGRTARDITPQLLERVAAVYRDNISGHPTKAVQHHFQVSQRMAAEYVSRARKRGLLPPTKRGKKNA